MGSTGARTLGLQADVSREADVDHLSLGGDVGGVESDEGDDPRVRELCDRLGAHHFSRKDRPQAFGRIRLERSTPYADAPPG